MNRRERTLLDLLKRGMNEFGYDGVKAEFEAEGSRTEDLLRLLDIARKANAKVSLKIGGCEALRDLFDCKILGADTVIAPMIESTFALRKYIDAKNTAYSAEEREDVRFLFNIESKCGYDNLNGLVDLASINGNLDGIVFGRSDFAASIGLSQNEVNSDTVTCHGLHISEACKVKDLTMAVGGGISVGSLNTLNSYYRSHLTHFETRKIVFKSHALMGQNIDIAISNAIEFEISWILNKAEFYEQIGIQDSIRLMMLQRRQQSV